MDLSCRTQVYVQKGVYVNGRLRPRIFFLLLAG